MGKTTRRRLLLKACTSLRQYCLENHRAANAFAFLGITQFLLTIWITIEFQTVVLNWLTQNLFLHLPVFGLACFANVAFMSAFVCLGFADTGKEAAACQNAMRGRYTGSKVMPGAFSWLSHAGGKKSRR